MEQNRFLFLIERYLSNDISLEDYEELRLNIAASDDGQLLELLSAAWEGYETKHDIPNDKSEQILAKILHKPKVRSMSFIRKLGWAAAIISFVVGGSYILFKGRMSTEKSDMVAKNAIIQPGKDGAILTLDDGSRISLDSVKDGVLAVQHGVSIRIVNGMVVYEGSSDELVYNTITTPKGRKYQITLSDNTKVWLNAASTVRYPIVFGKTHRDVFVSGEAYFEVAQNSNSPFRLSVNDKAFVDVLGTSFNVNSYEVESNTIYTTLVDGRIKISLNTDQKNNPGTTPDKLKSGKSASIVMTPGQQAIAGGDDLKISNRVNIESVIAWKNGTFYFEGVSFSDIMKEVERWYDVKVEYEGAVPTIQFEGEISRDMSLQDFLTTLSRYGVHYRLENRRVVVLR
ncbi:FecR family protein [Pinibacter aurantiacus]|uniref:DUF4974 domain-containing protein n=1 Tax=Pinibacter aurantiacus TaxID=2851599 RepID=A0A9E2W810_9BACT|nr:FecR family protein [Pinibacter aurantiacus]MBV4357302.1 DUF4974 domain-containing protein [Pinibacter aurantiacus]